MKSLVVLGFLVVAQTTFAAAPRVERTKVGPYQATSTIEILKPGVQRPDNPYAVDGLPFGKNRSTPPSVRHSTELRRGSAVLHQDSTRKLGYGWDYRATPDGSRLAIRSGDGYKARLELYRVEGGRLRRVYAQRSGRSRYIHDDHRFSPDGSLMIYPLKERDDTLSYKIVDTTTGRERLLVRTTGHSESGPPLFSPDGKKVGIFDGISNWVHVYDVASGRELGRRQIVRDRDLGFNVSGNRARVAGIDDGGQVVFR